MKKTLIAAVLAFISTLWAIAICTYVILDPVQNWMDSRFWETAARHGVLIPLLLSLLVLAASLVSLVRQYFKKGNP